LLAPKYHPQIQEIKYILGLNEYESESLDSLLTMAFQRHQRLEWLGDAVLQILSSELLYSRFPGISEGKLTEKRQILVNNENLARCLTSMGLDRYILAVSNSNVTKIRADVLEAILGAVYLSLGYQDAKTVLIKIWETVQNVEKGIDPVTFLI
jgi:dsRNA-specific ribonuclease